MTKKGQDNLRARLRTDTRTSHEELDREVSSFDLTRPDGFACFLRMQATALNTLRGNIMSQASAEMVCDLLERAEADLRQLGYPVDERQMKLDVVHPMAIDYVIAGSRLGTQILKKRWFSATDAKVRSAASYFCAPSYIEAWAAFRANAEKMPSTGPLADQIIRDTDRIFQIYRECARASFKGVGIVHA